MPASNTKIIIVEVQGGGGGSAAIVTAGYTCGSAGGGGYSRKTMANPGPQTYIVGAGGAARAAGDVNAGNTGESSGFGTMLVGLGGTGGYAASLGTLPKPGGSGGVASGGDVNVDGSDGGHMVSATAQGASGAFGGGSHTSKASYAPINAGQTSPVSPGSGACGRFTNVGAGTAGGDGWVKITELINF